MLLFCSVRTAACGFHQRQATICRLLPSGQGPQRVNELKEMLRQDHLRRLPGHQMKLLCVIGYRALLIKQFGLCPVKESDATVQFDRPTASEVNDRTTGKGRVGGGVNLCHKI